MLNRKVKVGIFWVIFGKVYGKYECIDINTNALEGRMDSSFEHWQVWEDRKRNFNVPIDRTVNEYFSFSRGRIIFDAKKSKHIVYCDSGIIRTNIKNLVLDYFGLKSEDTKFIADDHYVINSNDIDKMLD